MDFSSLRRDVIGADARVTTPFGERLMVYADYTASGRCVGAIERYLQELQCIYANTHTEDDISGRSMSQLLEQAETSIKQSVNAGEDGCIICVGTGATGAIDKLQQILGVALSPATRNRISDMLDAALDGEARAAFDQQLAKQQPVVFVGPYEHHSNEISWRQSLATVVEVNLTEDGGVDLEHLEALLEDPAYADRLRIGSFSAASNVTGRLTPVHEVAALLHRHGAIACFDYAACAPYVKIDMNPAGYEGDASLDAVFISPHKFLGGPGSSGVLVFNKRLYRQDLPPTVSAGGTVDYVSLIDQDFIVDIEEREKAGTPGVLQVLKAALAFQLKDSIGSDAIEAREHELLNRLFRRWRANPRLEILGHPDPDQRVAIVSFNVLDPHGRYLHPKFVTTLINDLFGIQSRAGCSCAGPYGHRLLHIDHPTSERYRDWIRKGYHGIKPGWCRVSLHYVMDDLEADYIMDAVEFVAEHGHRFLPLYAFDACTGSWCHRKGAECCETLSIADALAGRDCCPESLSTEQRAGYYASYLDEARVIAEGLSELPECEEFEFAGELEELKFFALPKTSAKAV